MVLQILFRQTNLGIFIMVATRSVVLTNICSGCYVFDNGDSYLWLTNDVDKVVQLLFPGILMWVLLPIVTDYLIGYARARSLGIALKLKL
jgi:hypothetical protein